MDALLAEIEREMGARRRRLTAAGLAATGAALLGAIALLVGSGVLRPDDATPCQGAADKLDGVWNARRKLAIRGSFRAAGGPAAGRTATQVEAALDRYAHSWRAMRIESCEATHVRGEQSAALLDLKSECLDHRLAELRALTSLFMAADPRMVPHAVPAVTSLEPVEQCGNSAALREMRPPGGAAARARVRRLRARLARGRALLWAGKVKDGLDVARAATADARALAHRPVEAEALHLLGSLQRAGGMLKAAEETLFAAAGAAESGLHAHIAADAWLELSRLVGESRDRAPHAHRLARLARGAIERLGGDAQREGSLEDWTGELYLAQGRMEPARDHLERGLALRLRALGGSHLIVAGSLQHMARLEHRRGELERALDLYRDARSIAQARLGADHARLAPLFGGEGDVLHEMGRHDEAAVALERALALTERSAGPGGVAESYLARIGRAHLAAGRPERAIAPLERVLALHERAARAPAELASARHQLARALQRAGRQPERARQLLRDARAGFVESGDANAAATATQWLRAPTPPDARRTPASARRKGA
jgi:tetratricopeptide (TPR) repeat protein